MLSSERLAAIKARSEAATPGPWFWNSYSGIFSAICEVSGTEAPKCERIDHDDDRCTPSVAHVPPSYGDTATGLHAADADFIASARTDVPELVAEVERLQACVAMWEVSAFNKTGNR